MVWSLSFIQTWLTMICAWDYSTKNKIIRSSLVKRDFESLWIIWSVFHSIFFIIQKMISAKENNQHDTSYDSDHQLFFIILKRRFFTSKFHLLKQIIFTFFSSFSHFTRAYTLPIYYSLRSLILCILLLQTPSVTPGSKAFLLAESLALPVLVFNY